MRFYDDHAAQYAPARQHRSPSADRARAPKPWTFKLGEYNGSFALATHLARFRNCQAYYACSKRDALVHLKNSLSGSVATILWALPENCTITVYVALLENRYGVKSQCDRYRHELRTRRRKKAKVCNTCLRISTALSLWHSWPAE